MTDRLLKNIYYDPEHEASFGGLDKLFKAAKREDHSIRKEQVQHWLQSQNTYTLHKQARRRFRRNPIISSAIGQHCEADLVDLTSLASENDGYKFLLTFIDVFSKKATAVPVASKSMKDIAKAFETILGTFICSNLRTDRGLEFRNACVQKVMKKYRVNLTFSHNQDVKAAVVERFNRTLKGKMFKYFSSSGRHRYLEVLPKLLISYNNSAHRSLRMAPNQVTAENSAQVFQNLYGFESVRDMLENGLEEKSAFDEGDNVRIRYVLTPMDKGYYPTFTDQVFTVKKVVKDHPRTMYRLEDFKAETIERKFYKEDLQLVRDLSYRVDRIIRRSRKFALVRWLNYPPSADTWVPLTAIKNVSRR